MKDRQLEWKKQVELLKQAVRVEGNYGNYSVLFLSNGYNVILNRKNLKFLLPSLGSLYIVPFDWKKWVKRGFIVIAFSRLFSLSEYYIFSAKDNRLIITGRGVVEDAFLKGESDYFILKSDDSKYAIFDKNVKRITDWYNYIAPYGLVEGRSDYYLATKDGKSAIFHKDGHQVSDWYNKIYPDGLVKGRSEYYEVKKHGKYAIFHKSGSRISNWFNYISEIGLVSGESDYYQAEKKGKVAIFHKDGKQVTDWYDWVYAYGLVWGQSEYYVGETDNLHYICKLGSTKVIGPFKKIVNYGFIEDPSQNSISVVTPTGQQKILTKQEIEDYFEKKEIENDR